jgi:hypothetical protein
MKSRHTRALLLALASIAVYGASASLAPTAMADKPNRIVLPGTDGVDPPGVDCPARLAPQGVRVRNLGPTSVLRVWDTGRQLLSGRHPDEYTNVATGQSVVLQLQGSADAIPQADGTFDGRLSGTTAFTFFPSDIGPGNETTSRTYVFTGEVKLLFDTSGAVIAFNSHGTMDDVCAMIA